ncbi:MAG TPA: FAD-binding oxidoreductase [Candidatus Methylomirabilis sp.]|nr:FAD-binding oxidoreductase [Candidatus Methylomirabilis sp.]
MADLAKTLEGIVGAEHVRRNGEAGRYAVDGVVPASVVFPGSVDEVSAVLTACSQAGAAVVPWGGGSSMGLGAVPRKVDVVLGLARLNQVIDHEPGDMTSTVQAGMVLRDYQAHLGRHGQFLSLDPPGAARATIGGILAANASGPRRLRYGTARDLLIGERVVHADGTVTKGGAKVVKNVTGYDMNKLYVGSLGTLGVIVEATFRLYPLPPAESTWLAPFPAAAQAREAVAKILDSALVPSAVELLNESAAAQIGQRAGIVPGKGPAVLAVAVASVPDGARAQLAQARHMGQQAGGGEGQMLEGEAHERFWAAVGDFDTGAGAAMVLKAGVLISEVAEAMRQGEEIAVKQRLQVSMISEAGTGIVRYHFQVDGAGKDSCERLAGAVAPLRAFAIEAKGSLVVLQAPPEVKGAVDVWGPVGDAFAQMRGLKEQFDPGHVLNPGRFVGGL